MLASQTSSVSVLSQVYELKAYSPLYSNGVNGWAANKFSGSVLDLTFQGTFKEAASGKHVNYIVLNIPADSTCIQKSAWIKLARFLLKRVSEGAIADQFL